MYVNYCSWLRCCFRLTLVLKGHGISRIYNLQLTRSLLRAARWLRHVKVHKEAHFARILVEMGQKKPIIPPFRQTGRKWEEIRRKQRSPKAKNIGKRRKQKAALKKATDDLWILVSCERRTAMRIHQYNRENLENIARVGTRPTQVSMFEELPRTRSYLPFPIPTL